MPIMGATKRTATRTAIRKRHGRTAVKPIALALQGGGSHGAFAWGVLDRLLEDRQLSFEGVSATSAGAMNAAVLAYGLLQGRDGARTALHNFWHAIARSAEFYSPVRQLPWLKRSPFALDHSPLHFWTDLWLRVFSPYEFNPLNLNPLSDVLQRHVDFAALRKHSPLLLYLCATNVETGKVRIFSSAEISVEAVLASACLPFLFQAVEIDGQHYWDGGYVGNPAIYPLIYNCDTRDVVIVHINPIVRRGVPRTATEILNRINEVSFNSSLMRELRVIAFVMSLIQSGKVARGELKEVLIHSIRSDETMAGLGVASKLNTDWEFLCHLRDLGCAQAEHWLAATLDDIGVRSSVDVHGEFL